MAATGRGPFRRVRGPGAVTGRPVGPGGRVVLWVLLAVAVVVAAALGWRARPGPDHLQWGEQPLVLVYHTHATEAFLPDLPGGDRPDRDIHRDAFTRDARRSIRAVGQALARRLAERGLDVVWSGTVYDAASRDDAYERARAGLKELLARHSSIRVALDVHRNATSTRVQVGGQPAAGVLLVVGAGHPGWHRNLALAEALADRLERIHPGLVRGIALKPWHYNQDLLPGSLIVEIGGAENTLAESLRTARWVADALVEALAIRPDRPPARPTILPPAPHGKAFLPGAGGPGAG
ncbi:stage II sporulation protein P [Thermaerobacter marianensis DSM 12885]|uniref:Stage II sporulation protein P n=1 Tax=Thermaerobacter marianensis (strain ATCC 700841 / DSM 12885 / JCM 10246 / 7p75a) TaxID=644966 RepID=E6SG56_THEM7|nr:stage II sporulation protein P [Thermaerobacter marianensis]ADU50473.1 stage II sporulation protein P [Thermaerobacter marianensis DSM 12885]